ncbi:MAG: hypothetical protein IJ518_03370 [Clostridia bacterium]|nr:hypothetical protein [Clostridia bacterium]
MTRKIMTRLAVAGVAGILAISLLVTGNPQTPAVSPDSMGISGEAINATNDAPQYKENAGSATAIDSEVFGAAGTDHAVAGKNDFGDKKGTTNPREHYISAAAMAAANFDNIPTMEGVEKDFIIEVQDHGYAPYSDKLQQLSMVEQRVGDTLNDFAHGTECYEWYTNTVYRLFDSTVVTRRDAIAFMQNWLNSQKNTHTGDGGVNGPASTMDSYTSMQHYVAETGFDLLGHEIGVSVSSFAMRIAFTRGAAKQFNENNGTGTVDAWWIDYSLWSPNGMVDYSNYDYWEPNDGTGIWGKVDGTQSNPLSGQSISACRRGYYLTYMSGAKWLINEAGGQIAFLPTLDENGIYQLSAHGEMFQEFYDFVQRNNDRGTTYVPFALYLDYEHGLPYADWMTPMAFELFPLEDGDVMNMDIMATLWPNGYPNDCKDEVGQQTAAPYGDTFDVILQNSDPKVLAAYKALVMTGEIELIDNQAADLVAYVNNGGTLVMNVAYQSQIAEFAGLAVGEHKYGKGRVIVYGEKAYDISTLPAILQQLEDEYVPVKVSSDNVEYLVNMTDDSVIVTVFNNNGITNKNNEVEQMDPDATVTLTVEYTGIGTVSQVNDWFTGEKLDTAAKQTLTIGPGDLAIIEFVL